MDILSGYIYRRKSGSHNELLNAFQVVGIPDTVAVHTVQQGADPNDPQKWDYAEFAANFEPIGNDVAQPSPTPVTPPAEDATQPAAPTPAEGTAQPST